MARAPYGALLAVTLALGACGKQPSVDAPPDAWANAAPTVVEAAVARGEHELLRVRQGDLRTWVQVPRVGARAGDHVLLGRGTARADVEIPEVGERAPEVVDIAHVKVVDAETARRAVVRRAPADAVSIGRAYAELGERAGTQVVVYGRVVKATSAVGSVWVHLQDGTGSAETGTHDLTVQTDRAVLKGQWVAFRGTLRKDVNLGFGYHYAALVERATLVE